FGRRNQESAVLEEVAGIWCGEFQSMKELLAKMCFAVLILWLLAPPPRAQMQVSSGRAIISQGGNDAVVSSAGALSANVAQFGGAATVTGTGAGGSGIPRVTGSNDSQVKPWD